MPFPILDLRNTVRKWLLLEMLRRHILSEQEDKRAVDDLMAELLSQRMQAAKATQELQALKLHTKVCCLQCC